jgi:hypothetical protein
MATETPLKVKELILKTGVTLKDVSAHAQCRLEEVENILHPETFLDYPFIQIVKVRVAVEQELIARGWNGKREYLWDEFDTQIKKAAINRLK